MKAIKSMTINGKAVKECKIGGGYLMRSKREEWVIISMTGAQVVYNYAVYPEYYCGQRVKGIIDFPRPIARIKWAAPPRGMKILFSFFRYEIGEDFDRVQSENNIEVGGTAYTTAGGEFDASRVSGYSSVVFALARTNGANFNEPLIDEAARYFKEDIEIEYL